MLENYDKWKEELLPAFCVTFHGCLLYNMEDDEHILIPFSLRLTELLDEALATGFDDKRVFHTLLGLFTNEPDDGSTLESCSSITCSMGRKNPQLFLESFLYKLPKMKKYTAHWAEDFLRFAITLDEFPAAFRAATEEQKTLMRQLAADISPVFVKNQTNFSGPIVMESLSLIRNSAAA
jgi:hypothetical protein